MEKDETWIVGRNYSNKYKQHIILKIIEEEIQDNGRTLWKGKRTNLETDEESNTWYAIFDREHWLSAEQVIEQIDANHYSNEEPVIRSPTNYAKDKYNDETKKEYRKA